MSLLPVVTGCYENFTPEIGTRPVLCVNSLITAGEPIEVDVTHSWVFNDEAGERDHSVDDAQVYIYVNGELQQSDYIPAEGDEISIVAESAKYGRAESSVTVPYAASVSSLKFTPVVSDLWKGEYYAMLYSLKFNMLISLTIKDNPGSEDFFNIQYNWQEPCDNYGNDDLYMSSASFVDFYPGTMDYNAEPIFKEHIGVFESVFGDDEIDGYMLFSDRQFSGQDYTLNLHFSNASYWVNSKEYDEELLDCKITFYIASVSRSYYNRDIYMWQRDYGFLGEFGDLGFAESIWGYSNVSSGAGIVAARSISTCTISLKDFLEATLIAGEQ